MSKTSGNSGMGLLGVLEIIFIVLKCIGVIDWSWWAVLIPFWINLGLVVIIALAALIINNNTK